MGSDIRYHVSTLIIVLFAVVIGVIMGANLTDPKKLEEREKKLTAKFDEVMRESRRVQQEADDAKGKNKETEEEMLSRTTELNKRVVHKRLTGKRIALIHGGGVRDFSAVKTTIVNTLQMAGAEVASVTEIDPRIIEDAGLLTAVAEQLKWPAESSSNVEQFAKLLANALAYGDSANSIPLLAKAKVVRIASDYSKPVDAVVFVGGADDSDSKLAEALDRPLIQALGAAKLNVVGCETEQAPLSFMGEYTRLHISTVDNIDSWSGPVALVCALAGQRGHYGVKAGAASKLPPLVP